MASIYISTCHNPYYNLAFEDYLYKQTLKHPVLLLWQNQPSVIIGRAQNPWLECNLPHMKKDGILLARRQSGGGAVYHDLGNLNITLFSPIAEFNKTNALSLVCETLKSYGINAYPNERHAIEVTLSTHTTKISGSAFRQSKHNAFHHLTLLINTDLNQLTTALQSQKNICGKGVKSVRSAVSNLCSFNKDLSIELISTSLIDVFLDRFQLPDNINTVSNEQLISQSQLQATYHEYRSWDWRFGKTLPFIDNTEIEVAGKTIPVACHVQNGKLTHIDHPHNDHPLVAKIHTSLHQPYPIEFRSRIDPLNA